MTGERMTHGTGGCDEKKRRGGISPILPSFVARETVVAGFTTRKGGVSLPPYASLNLGRGTPDNPDDVERNHALLYDYLGVDSRDVALMGQVHGSTVRVVESGGVCRETDGLVTGTRGILLCVVTADCVPVLLYSPSVPVIAAIHCGWRPISKNIIEKTVDELVGTFETKPSDIRASLGPSAGGCCYQVGDDVVQALDPSSVKNRADGRYADLRHELKLRLKACGLKDENIGNVGGCTICSPKLFYSYRRDGGHSGRMIGYIMLG